MRKFATLILAAVCSAGLAGAAQTRVACIGNSITYGMTLADREHESYPAQLQQLLGDDYLVGNFGRNGATLLRHGHNPYVKNPEYPAALDFRPDIAIIHLGTNDTDPRNWPNLSEEFNADYLALIDTLRAVNPQVRIIVANMAPIGTQHRRFSSGTRRWRDAIREAIPQVAQAAGVELIDFATPLRDRQNLIPDALHPTAEGAGLLAHTVYSAITGEYGGLQLPAVYGSGMVLPAGRRFTISGTDDARRRVSVAIGEQTAEAITDNCGRWAVSIAPLAVGGPYTVSVTDDAGDALRLTNVLAGEVWLASGQSNMEFRLRNAADSPRNLTPDTLLRVLNMQPRAYTNAETWDSLTCAAINRLDYYLPATWQQPDGDFSAVAYGFGRTLVDSLQVPVGIICNAIGGSGTEAWIDVETLQHQIPALLLDWTANDYLQPWVRQRAVENMGNADFGSRHPYEPSYLYSAGIRPLEGFPISGVIWYQGESNAHNVELHEQLFPMLVDSWRRAFGNPELPFIATQLSSLNRPSWPSFRDSQRRLAQTVDHSYMAVTSDLGDSLDVHPRRKAPVGRRLALQALRNVYGRTVTADGPTPVSCTAMPDGSLRLLMANARGMHGADGAAVRTFEMAEADGVFRPAHAQISDSIITLTNPDMKSPKFARYGWQAFTRANLVNSDSLPASTFRIEASEREGGLEYGVSGAYAGEVAGRPVVAGGCNFPYDDPIAVAPSAKRYYQGIYDAASGARLGSLPVRTAYGASVSTPAGLLMIGGEGLSDVWLFDGTQLHTLASLPCAVDNAYAATDGHSVYLVGGNHDGVPSAEVLMLDLADLQGPWRVVATMPGNPRVQPVAAISGDKLYVWGGFSPRRADAEPAVATEGLALDLASGRWTTVAAPRDGRRELTLSGGVAATLADGTIICTGGVNREIFLAAITCQAPDYLTHPVEWYRFNGRVCRFSPQTGSWQVEKSQADYARAGASAIVLPAAADASTQQLMLLGGEAKPRVRNPKTSTIECALNRSK